MVKAAAARPGLAARQAAFEVVRNVVDGGVWAGPAFDAVLVKSRLGDRDRGFAANLAWSTLRWQGTLDWALGLVVDRPLDAVDAPVRDVLRLGAYELLYGATPGFAAVASAVDLARAAIGPRPTGFVNAVLRRLAARADALPWPDEATDEGLALRLGWPAWAVAEARAAVGERAPALLAASNDPPGITLRLRPAVTGPRSGAQSRVASTSPGAPPSEEASRPEPTASVTVEGKVPLPGEEGRWSPEAWRAGSGDPRGLAVVVAGEAVVQDEASILVGHAAAWGMPAGALAYDLAAAPGGKAGHLADKGLRVVALDANPARTADMADRAGIRGMPPRAGAFADCPRGWGLLVAVADGRHPPLAPGSADLVLLDAPCTGLGVARRRPELRWRRRPGDPETLAALQAALLRAAAPLVKPGGRLLYSVCTWTPAETTCVVAAFLADHSFTTESPDVCGAGTPHGPGVLLAPDTDGTDGMFVASLRRSATP